jgi:hypothetical protein
VAHTGAPRAAYVLTWNLDSGDEPLHHDRETAGERRALDARQRTHVRQNAVVESGAGHRAVVLRTRQGCPHRQNAPRLKSRVDGLHAPHGTNQEA